MIRALCRKKQAPVPETAFDALKDQIPDWLTPGAAEALAVKVFRMTKTKGIPAEAALAAALKDYQAPVSHDIMEFQIGLAVAEASDLAFVPETFRGLAGTSAGR